MPPRFPAFAPPHCPNPSCNFHQSARGWRFRRFGFYRRRAAPTRVQRYRCTPCGRTFSSQTFSPTYWLRRPELLPVVWEGLVACSAYRQIARPHAASPSTIQTHVRRLGRQALLFLAENRPRGPLREPLAADGFESFACSQYHPLHLNLAVGAESHFLYAFTHAPLRRKGRMTEGQRRRRRELEARHGRPDPKALERSMADLLELLLPGGGEVTVRSDEHPAYPRAWRRVRDIVVRHEMTPSTEARTARNPLFPVNRMDLLLRHCGANHKRETIAFSKRDQGVVERLAVFAAWVNFQKSRSEKRRDGTPAQVLGLADRKLTTAEILGRRRFRSRVRVPSAWRPCYEGRIPTRGARCAPAPRYRFVG